MSSVDNRIVQMEFDNDQFEKGVSQTLTSLGFLDESIKDLSKSGNFTALSDAVNTIADRFSTMGIVAMTAIQNITDRVVDLGINMAKSLTVDQVMAGFNKYESVAMNAIAVVQQADISYEKAYEYVDKLAWYSDMTSFDLNSMTSALKSFASQGLDLEQSIDTIMGIGNAITYAGQSAKTGSAVFDIYSKAISAGYLNYMQFQQLSKTYGVATKKLKEDLIDVAVEEGTLTKVSDGLWRTQKGLDVTIENFGTTLGDVKGKWLTTNVMFKTFGDKYGKYASDLAAATLAYQEETGEVLTLTEAMEKLGNATDAMGATYLKSATVARTFTEAIDAVKDAASSQFSSMFQSIFGQADEAMDLWTEFSDWLNGIFVTPLSDLANILALWKELGGRTEFIDSIKEFSANVGAYFEPIAEQIDRFLPKLTGEGLKKATDRLNEFVKSLKYVEEETEKVEENTTGKLLDPSLISDINEQIKTTGKLFDENLLGDTKIQNSGIAVFLHNMSEALAYVANGINSVKTAWKAAWPSFEKGFTALRPAIEKIGELLPLIINRFGELLTNIGSNIHTIEFLKTLGDGFTKTMTLLANAISKVVDIITSFVSSKSLDAIGAALEKVINNFHPIESFFEFFKGIFDTIAIGIQTIAGALEGLGNNSLPMLSNPLGVLIGLWAVFEKIWDFQWLKKGVQTLKEGTSGFIEIIGGIKDTLGTLTDKVFADTIKSISEAILLMAASLLVLSLIPSEKIGGVIGLITVALVELGLFVAAMSQITKGPMGFKNSAGLTAIAIDLVAAGAAIILISGALALLATIDTDAMGNALGALTVIFVELGAFAYALTAMNPGAKLALAAVGLVAIAAAIDLITIGVFALGKMDVETLKQGLAGLGGLLVELALFASILTLVGGADMLAGAAAIVLIATAVDLISIAILALGLMDFEKMGQGLLGMAGILAELGIFCAIMDQFDSVKILAISVAMGILAVAIDVLCVGLAVLSLIPMEQLVNGLIALGALLAEIWAFTKLMSNSAIEFAVISPSLLVFSAAILVLVAALTVLALIPFWDLIGAIAGLAVALAVIGGATMLLSPLAAGMILVAAGIAAISAALIILGEAMIKITEAIILLKAAFGKGKKSIIDDSDETVKKVTENTRKISKEVKTTAEDVDKSTSDGAKSAEENVETASENIADSANEASDETSDAFARMKENMAKYSSEAGIDVTSIFGSNFDELNNLSLDKLGNFDTTFQGFGAGIKANSQDAGEGAVEGFEKGLNGMDAVFDNLGKDYNNEFMRLSADARAGGNDTGAYLCAGTREGIDNNKWGVYDKITEFGNGMIWTLQDTLEIHSPSRKFAELGKFTDLGFAKGIEDFANLPSEATEDMGKQVLNSLKTPMSKVSDILEDDIDLSPKIKPVLDLSNIQNGSKFLNNLTGNSSLMASINGNINSSAFALSSVNAEINSLKAEFGKLSANQMTDSKLATALNNALKNVDLYMDSTKVGKMISNYQASASRAAGA